MHDLWNEYLCYITSIAYIIIIIISYVILLFIKSCEIL